MFCKPGCHPIERAVLFVCRILHSETRRHCFVLISQEHSVDGKYISVLQLPMVCAMFTESGTKTTVKTS